MLRKITRPITSKQTIVNDHHHTKNNPNFQWFSPHFPTKPYFLPFFFKGFTNSKMARIQMITPISIFDQNPFSILTNFQRKPQKNHSWDHSCTKKGIVLALIDEKTLKNKQKNVVFGPQLRIKLKKSTIFQCFSNDDSPREFGIKTPRNKTRVHPREMVAENNGEIDEKSEEYTCVILHGPNPKTTHIYGDCIVEKCCDLTARENDYVFTEANTVKNVNLYGNLSTRDDDGSSFVKLCYYCKKELGHGNDIYMFRGEKAFCSEECRSQEMFF